VRISAGMVGILLISCKQQEFQPLTPGGGLEGTTTRVRMNYSMAESELLTEYTMPRRLQSGKSYKFPTGLEVSKEGNGNPRK
jgi:hypothetical protein